MLKTPLEKTNAMGLFDLFKGGNRPGAPRVTDKPTSAAVAAAKWAEKAGDKRAQNYDRQEALSALAEMGTAEAAAALLRRFTFKIDPSITDQEEKDVAYNGVLRAGANAIEPVRAFAAKAESLAWPMKILKDLLEEDAYVEELTLWLARWDVEYAKFIDPKLQILSALSEYKHEKIMEAVQRFLEDVDEEARFRAVDAVVAQDDANAVSGLLDVLVSEESFRVKNKIAQGILTRGWRVPEDRLATVRKVLPPGYTADAQGRLNKLAAE
jgi:HEAT repeat protein